VKPRYVTLALVALISVVAVSAAAPATSNDGPPGSIAAIGDSITTGACTGSTCADRPDNSWSTGTNPAVDSHFLHLRAIFKSNPNSVHAYNFATSALVTMADLEAQARQAVARKAQYVTIELGENDLCGGTPLATFRSGLERGLAVLSKLPPTRIPTKILLLSIENLAEHWRVLHADPAALKAFKAGQGIDCGLGDRVTRAQLAHVRARTLALNRILAEVCGKHPLCLYDAGTYYRLPLKARYFSPADYQHLSLAGQRALAAAEWKVALKILYY
jgi:lysophospholipase L1-like esterase